MKTSIISTIAMLLISSSLVDARTCVCLFKNQDNKDQGSQGSTAHCCGNDVVTGPFHNAAFYCPNRKETAAQFDACCKNWIASSFGSCDS
ncbi:hypothetical protein COL5a_004053 [Colletotrichum fioriniae]|uniref:Uncharacterized protein n=1 Tax=Colletotrichum fioriniae PJ7 TaxID=1445577 RepID=A0A010QEA4_9PEZI|nr:uncharacterized protein COL516b_000130 [Colletotrichum fioriniae]EXF78207.1 hypothetical protein CFIO01_00202 [Colletotrichum fioriniae PJ7]KAJ0313201.1 hypothetical protein COL516b_000130 [Colletotrichum fioriniae]KAJ0329493.1 hypothetical protein COL5a_004053 [Colletotrichum fioriniae]KAJ3948474.1 hypothetical protein N0V96_002727 [Colletotrichum fioriniae]